MSESLAYRLRGQIEGQQAAAAETPPPPSPDPPSVAAIPQVPEPPRVPQIAPEPFVPEPAPAPVPEPAPVQVPEPAPIPIPALIPEPAPIPALILEPAPAVAPEPPRAEGEWRRARMCGWVEVATGLLPRPESVVSQPCLPQTNICSMFLLSYGIPGFI